MKPQSLLFTIYGEYVRHHGGEIWVGSLTRLMGEFGMSEQAVRVAISRIVSQGWLKARKIGNRSYYSMTPRGKKRLDEAGARIYKQTSAEWNGKWCIATYNIPEKKRAIRDQLRKELSWMGFGMLANSTWISPHDLAERVKEIAESYNISDHVEIFTSEYMGIGTDKQLVEKCWNLDEINDAYRKFIRQYQPQYEKLREQIIRNQEISDSKCFVEKTELVHEYRKFLFIDPSLPDELLPDFWVGREADQLFRDYYSLLDPGAVRFFLSVFETAPNKK
ncbi:phenylacetic acid degradation operon negative regulatory protein PaaX [Effusibacillus lacus]|uniref:Phenylacetic acid degradation operon negative regulatory protein PaaX n=1 Tax=Effusibacillus lacus TaxID=1348429 RepID=A0A292YG17_9BACL|nr:phenylacetic acid degradation operon negative regulatory protein PaaX [Effusibacillus lacus]TCS72795.1 PaaX family transcriptional regulator [Effusibacillus lacus]GAX89277.1 phenylacetic acid degradation operon negative regulatory protein PaaX [Effusibacillus lacus]